MPDQIKKRNGSVVGFDRARIERAMEKAFIATGVSIGETQLSDLTNLVMREIDRKFVERVP